MELKASVKVQKIQAELAKLKEEQAKKEAEWESAQNRHEETLCILRSQIGEATKVYVRNVLGTLQVLYPAMDLHQVATYYDDEGHLAAMERAEEEIDGLATTITDELDLRMKKPNEQAM